MPATAVTFMNYSDIEEHAAQRRRCLDALKEKFKSRLGEEKQWQEHNKSNLEKIKQMRDRRIKKRGSRLMANVSDHTGLRHVPHEMDTHPISVDNSSMDHRREHEQLRIQHLKKEKEEKDRLREEQLRNKKEAKEAEKEEEMRLKEEEKRLKEEAKDTKKRLKVEQKRKKEEERRRKQEEKRKEQEAKEAKIRLEETWVREEAELKAMKEEAIRILKEDIARKRAKEEEAIQEAKRLQAIEEAKQVDEASINISKSRLSLEGTLKFITPTAGAPPKPPPEEKVEFNKIGVVPPSLAAQIAQAALELRPPPPLEHQVSFKPQAQSAADIGRCLRLAERSVEAMGCKVRPDKAEQQVLLEQKLKMPRRGGKIVPKNVQDMNQILTREAAGKGFLKMLIPQVTTNYDPEDEDDGEIDIDKLRDEYGAREVRTKFLIDKNVQARLDWKVHNFDDEELSPGKYATEDVDLSEKKLPRFKRPNIKGKTSGEIREELSKGVAEGYWSRYYRLERPGQALLMSPKCKCKYCVNPNAFQTYAYQKKWVQEKNQGHLVDRKSAGWIGSLYLPPNPLEEGEDHQEDTGQVENKQWAPTVKVGDQEEAMIDESKEVVKQLQIDEDIMEVSAIFEEGSTVSSTGETTEREASEMLQENKDDSGSELELKEGETYRDAGGARLREFDVQQRKLAGLVTSSEKNSTYICNGDDDDGVQEEKKEETSAQIYKEKDEESPAHDLDSSYPNKQEEAPSHRRKLTQQQDMLLQKRMSTRKMEGVGPSEEDRQILLSMLLDAERNTPEELVNDYVSVKVESKERGEELLPAEYKTKFIGIKHEPQKLSSSEKLNPTNKEPSVDMVELARCWPSWGKEKNRRRKQRSRKNNRKGEVPRNINEKQLQEKKGLATKPVSQGDPSTNISESEKVLRKAEKAQSKIPNTPSDSKPKLPEKTQSSEAASEVDSNSCTQADESEKERNEPLIREYVEKQNAAFGIEEEGPAQESMSLSSRASTLEYLLFSKSARNISSDLTSALEDALEEENFQSKSEEPTITLVEEDEEETKDFEGRKSQLELLLFAKSTDALQKAEGYTPLLTLSEAKDEAHFALASPEETPPKANEKPVVGDIEFTGCWPWARRKRKRKKKVYRKRTDRYVNLENDLVEPKPYTARENQLSRGDVNLNFQEPIICTTEDEEPENLPLSSRKSLLESRLFPNSTNTGEVINDSLVEVVESDEEILSEEVVTTDAEEIVESEEEVVETDGEEEILVNDNEVIEEVVPLLARVAEEEITEEDNTVFTDEEIIVSDDENEEVVESKEVVETEQREEALVEFDEVTIDDDSFEDFEEETIGSEEFIGVDQGGSAPATPINNFGPLSLFKVEPEESVTPTTLQMEDDSSVHSCLPPSLPTSRDEEAPSSFKPAGETTRASGNKAAGQGIRGWPRRMRKGKSNHKSKIDIMGSEQESIYV